MFVNEVIASNELLHETTCLVLCQFLFDSFAEIAVAEFGDYVCIVLGGVDLV